jgi:hypothetical protein
MEANPAPTPAPTDLRDLQAQFNQLQQLITSLLLILIVISGTLTIFLLRQWRFSKAEVDSLTPAVIQLNAEHMNNYGYTQELARKLAEYGKSHPDFAQIVSNYNLNSFLANPGTASVMGSLPQSPATKK